MKKWNLIIDVAKCHDCNNCFLSCKDEFCENDHLPHSAAQPKYGHRWMNIERKERGQYPKVDVAYLPHPCMHCDQPACMDAAPDGAVIKRDDGLVIIDPEKAKGQKTLIEACPYDAIWWNEAKEIPQKCNLCSHLLDKGWREPRCVQSCPTGALSVVLSDSEEMEDRVKQEQLEAYQPQFNTKPRVLYKNLYRYTRYFIAGSVALGDVDECAEGAKVTLSCGNDKKTVTTTLSNNYGDFKFDNLPPDHETFTLEMEYPGYDKQTKILLLTDSINIGVILLSKYSH